MNIQYSLIMHFCVVIFTKPTRTFYETYAISKKREMKKTIS